MTANSFTSVSLDPALVLVCVENDSRFHEAVLAAGLWGVSVLDRTARARASWFATRGRPLEGQFGSVAYHRGPVTGVALLDQSLATLECRTTAVHRSGDHDIVVGEVLAMRERAPDGEPLLYWTSHYHSLGAPVPSSSAASASVPPPPLRARTDSSTQPS